ncbi:family 2A encapsulin nanocompartment cargo protein cysteine desulfurase [Nevskia ramosa]|uniref:family 2A encapsulin nanocompartment cargo protein cysteine desulfurase n=1 Tax=Nevskia ramosa TaxID=64002 RepID=UPI0003B5FCE3|nr:family 2A encapsulin nanocompartment cargo protein cysteine desulfurase [Nevskia ramosa]
MSVSGSGLDASALQAMANAMFSAPPGAEPAFGQAPAAPSGPINLGSPLPPGGIPVAGQNNPLPVATSLPMTPPVRATQPGAAELAAPPSFITPRVVPTQAQTPDLHGLQSTVLPALPKGGNGFAGVPEGFAALLPGAAPTPNLSDAAVPSSAQPPSSPYYFLGDASSASGVPESPQLNLASLSDPFGLSAPTRIGGEPPRSSGSTSGAPSSPQSNVSAPSFYFADLGASPGAAKPLPKVSPGRGAFDVQAVRRDFPILSTRVSGGKPLVWLDNAATTQKPQSVIDRISYFYANENSNIHRAAHELAARATDAYEAARKKVTNFIGASSPEEIIFVRGTTEGINLVAQSWGKQNIGEGDEIVVSHLEHHANIVPWQMLAAEKGAVLRVIPVDNTGQVRLDEYQKLLSSRTKIVAVTQVSNALGTVVPVKEIIDLGHRYGAKVLIDGAQSVSHMRVDVQALDADFFVFSGHKLFGPTGIGVVYGKRDLLEHMPPHQGGGNMIEDVTFDKTVYQGPPARFEAGTGNIADAVGLGAAIDYVERIGIENIARQEHDLLEYGTEALCRIPGLCMIGTAKHKTSVMSFVLEGFTTAEVGQALSEEGIAVRTGHHCAQPILRRFGLEFTVRPSLAFYNTFEEIDLLAATVRRLSQTRRRG